LKVFNFNLLISNNLEAVAYSLWAQAIQEEVSAYLISSNVNKAVKGSDFVIFLYALVAH